MIGRTFQLDMRIPPGTQSTQSKILVTCVQPSEKGDPSIDDDQFPVIAKVDLKVPAKLSIRDEGLHGHARVAQFSQIGVGKSF